MASTPQPIVPIEYTISVSEIGKYPTIQVSFDPPTKLTYEEIVSRVMGSKEPVCYIDTHTDDPLRSDLQKYDYDRRTEIIFVRLGVELRIDDTRETLETLNLSPAPPLLALMPFMIPSILRTITNDINMFSMVTFWGNPEDCAYLFLSKRCSYMVIERPGKLQYLPPTCYYATIRHAPLTPEP